MGQAWPLPSLRLRQQKIRISSRSFGRYHRRQPQPPQPHTRGLSEALLDSFLSRAAGEGSVLTYRERGVVQLIAEGYTNKQIAGLLDISVKTVKSHRAAIMRKLNLSSPTQLVRYAIRNQIVEP